MHVARASVCRTACSISSAPSSSAPLAHTLPSHLARRGPQPTWRRAPAHQLSIRTAASSSAPAEPAAAPLHPITLTDAALSHLKKLREESGGASLLLRMGVKSGGCSGMSYFMEFCQDSDVTGDDTVIEMDGFKLVTDPKSLLYLFGMQMDYSNELIGGGFKFINPNASNECGCGKSFGV